MNNDNTYNKIVDLQRKMSLPNELHFLEKTSVTAKRHTKTHLIINIENKIIKLIKTLYINKIYNHFINDKIVIKQQGWSISGGVITFIR